MAENRCNGDHGYENCGACGNWNTTDCKDINNIRQQLIDCSKENEALTEEREGYAGRELIYEAHTLNAIKDCEKAEAERDRLRELLFSIGKYACGEDQLDVLSDTEALLELAKLVGHYEDPPRYSPEALNHKETPPKDKRYCCAARGWYNQPCTCNHKEG